MDTSVRPLSSGPLLLGYSSATYTTGWCGVWRQQRQPTNALWLLADAAIVVVDRPASQSIERRHAGTWGGGVRIPPSTSLARSIDRSISRLARAPLDPRHHQATASGHQASNRPNSQQRNPKRVVVFWIDPKDPAATAAATFAS